MFVLAGRDRGIGVEELQKRRGIVAGQEVGIWLGHACATVSHSVSICCDSWDSRVSESEKASRALRSLRFLAGKMIR